MADRWYVTLEVQMAIDARGSKEELEEILNTANNIDVNIEGVEDTYNPDMVTCTFLERG